MKARNVDIGLSVEFKASFFIGSGFGLAGIIDLMTLKDGNGVVYVPGSSLKGKIKAEFRKILVSLGLPACQTHKKSNICDRPDISETCALCRMFGSESYEGALIFEDVKLGDSSYELALKLNKGFMPSLQSSPRTGLKINRLFKTAEPEALFFTEAANNLASFVGRIHGTVLATEEEYLLFIQTIESNTHLGGQKSRGLGRCQIKAGAGDKK